MIDVAALDSHNLEQHEYKERTKQYQQRLLMQGTSQRWHLSAPSLLIDIPMPEKVLAAPPLSYADMDLVSARSVALHAKFAGKRMFGGSNDGSFLSRYQHWFKIPTMPWKN